MVYGSNPCGNTETRSIQVDVIAAPFVRAMDDATICDGEEILLEVIESTGIVEWNVEDLIVSPVEETTYTVTATNLCGVAEDQVIIKIATPPSLAVMDDVTICEGEEVELTAKTNGVLTWCSGINMVAPTVTSTFTATTTNSCGSVEDHVVVTVKPLPTLSVMADKEICIGEEVTLIAESDVVVSWSSGTNIVSPDETTTYTAFAEKEGCTAEDRVTIIVHPLPDIPVLTQKDGRLISDVAAGNIWFLNGSKIDGAEGNEHEPAQSGDYHVIVINDFGCVSEPSNTISFTVSNVINIGMNEISVFPNPVTDRLHIIPGAGSGVPFKVELLSTEGRVLIFKNINNSSFIDVGHLASSIYILRIIQGDEYRLIRIVKN